MVEVANPVLGSSWLTEDMVVGDRGAHVVYVVVVVGRTHMQTCRVYRKERCGPSFGNKCMSLCGPIWIWCISLCLGHQ